MEWFAIVLLIFILFLAFKPSKKSKGKTSITAPSIKQSRSFPPSIELHLPTSDNDEDISIRSFAEVGKHYIINLHTMKCSCEDFSKTRADKRIDSTERLCKHLRKAMLDSSFIRNTVYQSILSETYSSKSYCRLEAVDAIVGFTEGNEWLNIYTITQPDHIGEIAYARYGYSLIEKRWSYGKAPFNGEMIESTIYRIFPTGPDAVQRKSPQQNSVVIEVKLTTEDLARALSSASMPSKTKALSGTFNDSYFINSETGKFQFPKYKHDNHFTVQITDNTNYKEMFQWDLFDQKERERFSLSEFELLFGSPEIEVETFNAFLSQIADTELNEVKILKGHGEEIEDMYYELLQTGYTISNNEFRKFLLAKGYFTIYEFVNPSEENRFYQSILSGLKVNDLRSACAKAKIETKDEGKELKKGEIVTKVLQSGKAKDVIGNQLKPIFPNGSFSQLLDPFYDSYINSIKENLKRFHPLYYETVWEETLLSINKITHPNLIKKVKDIKDSKYWEAYLTNAS